jgi:hypothetical protein
MFRQEHHARRWMDNWQQVDRERLGRNPSTQGGWIKRLTPAEFHRVPNAFKQRDESGQWYVRGSELGVADDRKWIPVEVVLSFTHIYDPVGWDRFDPKVWEGQPIRPGARVAVWKERIDPMHYFVVIQDEAGNRQAVKRTSIRRAGRSNPVTRPVRPGPGGFGHGFPGGYTVRFDVEELHDLGIRRWGKRWPWSTGWIKVHMDAHGDLVDYEASLPESEPHPDALNDLLAQVARWAETHPPAGARHNPKGRVANTYTLKDVGVYADGVHGYAYIGLRAQEIALDHGWGGPIERDAGADGFDEAADEATEYMNQHYGVEGASWRFHEGDWGLFPDAEME